jgi:2,3-bisphosphoglycerate-dependent phosphoglycerate mutase
MPRLLLLRHFQSQWNLENRFTGWVDIPLAQLDLAKVKEIAEKVANAKIDVVFSSPLVRNQTTVSKVLEYMGEEYPIFFHLEGKAEKWAKFNDIKKGYLPVYLSQALNERCYGKLQGLNKELTAQKYGAERVKLWRRSFNQSPPGGESLKDVFKRAVPFYRRYVEKTLREDKNVLIVASHNSLRALLKYIEKVSDQEIINKEIPCAGIIEYEFDRELKLKNKKTI